MLLVMAYYNDKYHRRDGNAKSNVKKKNSNGESAVIISVVCIKLDIYVFIIITVSIPLLVDYLSQMVSSAEFGCLLPKTLELFVF